MLASDDVSDHVRHSNSGLELETRTRTLDSISQSNSDVSCSSPYIGRCFQTNNSLDPPQISTGETKQHKEQGKGGILLFSGKKSFSLYKSNIEIGLPVDWCDVSIEFICYKKCTVFVFWALINYWWLVPKGSTVTAEQETASNSWFFSWAARNASGYERTEWAVDNLHIVFIVQIFFKLQQDWDTYRWAYCIAKNGAKKKMGVITLLVQLGSMENDKIGYFACSYFQLAQSSVNGGWKWKISVRLACRASDRWICLPDGKTYWSRPIGHDFCRALKELKWPWNVCYWSTSVISLCNHFTSSTRKPAD